MNYMEKPKGWLKGWQTRAAGDPLTSAGVNWPIPFREFCATFRRESILHLFPRWFLTDGNTLFTWFEDTNEGKPGPQGTEGTAKAQMHEVFTSKTMTLSTISGFIKISRQAMEDASVFYGWIDNKLRYEERAAIEDYIINIFDTATLPTATTLMDAYAQVLIGCGRKPTGLIIHPTDYASLLKNLEGAFFLHQTILSELEVVITTAVAVGGAIIGNFHIGCLLAEREEMDLSITQSDQSDFVNNIATLRWDWHGALAIMNTNCFCIASAMV